MKHLRVHLAILASALLLVSACKKDDPEEEDPVATTEHISVLKDTENWKTVAYSEDFFVGNTAHNFAVGQVISDMRFLESTINYNRPAFLTNVVRGNLNTEDFYSYDLLLKDDAKMIIHDLNIGFGWFSNFNSKFYSSSVGMGFGKIKDEDGRDFEWENYVHNSHLAPAYADTIDPIKQIYESAEPALTELNGETTMVYGGSLYYYDEDNQHVKKPCVVGKYWNAATDSLDLVSVIEPDSSFSFGDLNEYRYGYTTVYGDKILYVIHNVSSKKLYLFHGDFENGFEQVGTFSSDIWQITAIKYDENAAYIIWASSDSEFTAIKINQSGAVSTFDIDAGFDTEFCVYKGDLIGTLTVNGMNGIYKIDASGATSLGDANLLTEETNRIYFATDKNHLFAAVMNGISPGFASQVNQFKGWEIIEYQP